MMLNICVEVDAEADADELELAASEHEEVTIRTAGRTFQAAVIDVAEAGGRRG